MYTYRWDMSSPSRYWLNSVLFQAGDWVAIIHLDGSNILPIQLYNEVTVPSSDVVHVQMCAYMYLQVRSVTIAFYDVITYMYVQVYDEVTILFSDVVGFTNICSQIQPMEVVSLLNDMYTMFDKLTEQFRVYKVTTAWQPLANYMGWQLHPPCPTFKNMAKYTALLQIAFFPLVMHRILLLLVSQTYVPFP